MGSIGCGCSVAHKAVTNATTSLWQFLSPVISDSSALHLALSDSASSRIALVGTASAVLALSKAAWKLGSALSKLHQDTKIFDTTVKNLAGEVKSLGNECDLVYAELEEVIGKGETGSPQPYDVDDRMWVCLATQVEETSRTMQDLELFVRTFRVEEFSFIGQAQRQRKLDQSKDQITIITTKVCRQTENLRTTLLLINTVRAHIAPCRGDRELAKELDKLQNMVEKLQRSLEADLQLRPSHTEATLMQCAREVIEKGTTTHEASLAVESFAGSRGTPISTIHAAEWVSTLESIRQDQQRTVQEHEAVFAGVEDPEDDLDTDLAKAALDTGSKAFEAQEWEEADSLLQEALQVLQQLPKQQRAFCDLLDLQYKLAVCAYHMQEPTDAEEALMSVVQQSASPNKQCRYIYDAAHLLSLLYIRIGQVDRARSECEKALQARRRLLGKLNNASLESTALMAHIYVLLNNRARAKSYLAMIPEASRGAVLKVVQDSLDTKVENLNSPSLRTQSMYEDSDPAEKHVESRLSTYSLAQPMESRSFSPVTATTSQASIASLRQAYHRTSSNQAGSEVLKSVTGIPLSPAEDITSSRASRKEGATEDRSTNLEAFVPAALSPGEPSAVNETFQGKTLSRKEILDKIGSQPRNRIEEAVCEGNHSVFASLLDGKKHFWQSKFRKRIRPERVTALHFAALFGEIDMARRLLGSNFNINEIPYGYTSNFTPLKFAIGARQADMVEFLIANGAKPCEPDSWSTLAGQLMNRSWLMKTMSEAEKEYVPDRIIAILTILLKHGWAVNAPFETSGRTVLHQAVTFWTGSYIWDLNLRAAITSFLCEQGADPFQPNVEGKTPYDMALASGHQDLLLVLSGGLRKKELDIKPGEPFELST